MLILTRKLGEKIAIGDEIFITLLEIKGSQVKLGIEAPKTVDVHREEIYEKIRNENLGSTQVNAPDMLEALSLLRIHGTRVKKK